MNPGKIVNAPPPTENLRFGPSYANHKIDTFLDFSREGGFEFAVEMCNGNGQCRKLDAGTMCPSFQATQDDRHSTRGRANALRALIAGTFDMQAYGSRELYEVMDLCLECKACRTECPSKVDMAKMKYEFLHQYNKVHGVPLRTRLFTSVDLVNRLGTFFAPVSNWMMGFPLNRWVMGGLGIAPKRRLPPFASQRFSRWFRRRKAPAGADERPPVVLFHDTFMEYNHPELGHAAVAVLEHAGYRVQLVPRKCCGRPMISKGLLEQARRNARHNVNVLREYADAGVPIVGVEPSCILTLREDYPDLLPGAETNRVAARALTIDEFLGQLIDEGKLALPDTAAAQEIWVHGHCHQKSLVGMAPTLKVLRALPGATVHEIEAGCCGMAGSFGYEKEHYAISQTIGEQRLFPAVRAADAADTVVADGISCRQQIAHGTGRGARHLVQVVADALALRA
jgi:Fe-S oxidoreductase